MNLNAYSDSLLIKRGYQWRLLPNDFPPYPICFYYFPCWQADGRWAQLNKVGSLSNPVYGELSSGFEAD